VSALRKCAVRVQCRAAAHRVNSSGGVCILMCEVSLKSYVWSGCNSRYSESH